eukprot:NODE_12_length_54577_cov_0.384100.p24 type:complete len:231 gc:universal NODE_12_length_54577_cov_0.384100:6261-6953(+)
MDFYLEQQLFYHGESPPEKEGGIELPSQESLTPSHSVSQVALKAYLAGELSPYSSPSSEATELFDLELLREAKKEERKQKRAVTIGEQPIVKMAQKSQKKSKKPRQLPMLQSSNVTKKRLTLKSVGVFSKAKISNKKPLDLHKLSEGKGLDQEIEMEVLNPKNTPTLKKSSTVSQINSLEILQNTTDVITLPTTAKSSENCLSPNLSHKSLNDVLNKNFDPMIHELSAFL